MNDSTARSTEAFLDSTIDKTSELLRDEFAHLIDLANSEARTLEKIGRTLGLDIEAADVDESVVADVTWHPVAEICVVALLRNLLQRAGKGPARLTLAEVANLNRTLGTPEFATRAGLSSDDVRIALGLTARLLVQELSKSIELEMDGSRFVVYGEPGALIVKPAKQVEKLKAGSSRSARAARTQTGHLTGS